MADWPVLQKKRWESFCLRHLLKPKCSFHGCGVSRCFALFWLPPNAHRTQASPGAPGGPGSPPPPAALWRRRPRLAGPPAGWRRGPRSNHGPAGANPVPEGGYPWSDAITTKRRGEKPRREMAWHICQGTGWGWAQSKKGVSEYWALRSRLQFVQDPFSQFQCGPCQHQSPVVADIVALWFSAGWSTATGRAGGGGRTCSTPSVRCGSRLRRIHSSPAWRAPGSEREYGLERVRGSRPCLCNSVDCKHTCWGECQQATSQASKLMTMFANKKILYKK